MDKTCGRDFTAAKADEIIGGDVGRLTWSPLRSSRNGLPCACLTLIMCKRCEEIVVKIAYYRRLLAKVEDRTAISLLGLVVADLKSDKVGLHPVNK